MGGGIAQGRGNNSSPLAKFSSTPLIGIVDVEFERELYIHKHEVSDDIISNERVRDLTLARIIDIRVST